MISSSFRENVMERDTGRTIIIVGGGSGIGLECVAIARASYDHVVVADIAPLHEIEAPSSILDDVLYFQVDVTVAGAFDGVAQQVVEQTGRVDALVNMIGGAHPKPFLEMTVDDWDGEISFNLRSAFLTCRSVAEVMVAQGGGAIVNASSGFGSRAAPGRIAYGAAKAGILGFSRSLAAELGPRGVRVNVIAPGPTDTARFRNLLTEDEVAAMVSLAATGRLSEPRDSAEAAMFLVSPAARQITGQILHVNGGVFMPAG